MITFEYTDTFGGEANYCWVKRYHCAVDMTAKSALRLAKRLFGLTGTRCRVENQGDLIAIYPRNCCTVAFVAFESDDIEGPKHFGVEIDEKGIDDQGNMYV